MFPACSALGLCGDLALSWSQLWGVEGSGRPPGFLSSGIWENYFWVAVSDMLCKQVLSPHITDQAKKTQDKSGGDRGSGGNQNRY